MNEHIKVGDILDLEIRRMGINGEGIGYYKKLAIFVDHALPDEKVSVEIKEVFDNRAVGNLLNVINRQKDRVTPFCPIYESCGGCQSQHVSYEKMLEYKKDILMKSFDRYAGLKIKPEVFKNTKGAKNPMHYRNKASLPVQHLKGKNLLGMYAKNSNQFIPLDECPIQHPLINQVLKTILKLMNSYGVDAIDPKTKKGYVRHLVVRVAEGTDEVQVSFILVKKSNRLEDLTQELIKLEPKIVSVYEVINPDLKKMGFFSDDQRLIFGKEMITEILNQQTYYLKPDAFFQLNAKQADVFYQEMRRLAQMKPHEIAIDAYAGVAPVSHYIHKDAKHVYAIEIDQASCDSAKLSLEKNNITNVSVLQSDFNRALSGLKEKKIDVMFFDPPRVGLGEETISLILKFKPKRLIYGSCNPSTLAKDLNTLLKHYDLIECVPIDMFPYTSLVESVSLLRLKVS